jgi:hypothetical protein
MEIAFPWCCLLMRFDRIASFYQRNAFREIKVAHGYHPVVMIM